MGTALGLLPCLVLFRLPLCILTGLMLRNQQILQCIDRFLVGVLDCVQIPLCGCNIAVTEARLHLLDLTTAEQVLGGSFLQVLERQEDQRRKAESGAVPNGQMDADAPLESPRMSSRRR